MNCWSVYLLVGLALLFSTESSAEENDEEDDDEEYEEYEYEEYDEYDDEVMEYINPDQIVFKISNTSHSIIVTWRILNTQRDAKCYRTEVQYKSQCDNDWKGIELKQEHEEHNLSLSTLSMKRNYDFRIRMKLACVQKNWSNWTKVQSWGNKDACRVELPTNIWVYILIIVLPLTAFLLVWLLTLQGIRRLILPKVPNPNNKIMDIDQSQWWGNLMQLNEECTTTDIEIIDKNEREEEHQTLVMEPIDANSSGESSDENIEPQYSQMVLGYHPIKPTKSDYVGITHYKLDL